MPLDLNKYRRALHPTNIFEILPRPIIEQIIRGFFYHMKKGVTLLWAEYDSEHDQSIIQDERLDPFDYSNPKDREFYNEVCWEYRSRCEDPECHNCDKQVAQECVDANRTEVVAYPCWLGMDDLAYPLRIGERVYAVLFAGQIIPNDPRRVAEIEAMIRERVGGTNQALGGCLINLLHEERKAQQDSDPEYGSNLLKRLSNFGDMLQKIVTRLYEAGRNAAQQELLQSVESSFGYMDLADSDRWWVSCRDLVNSVTQLVGLDEIDVYVRNRSHYRQSIPNGTQAVQLALREVLSSLPAGCLHAASKDSHTRQLAGKLTVPNEATWFYVSHTQAEGTPLSTFIVLRGELRPEYEELTAALCRIISQNVDFFSLVARQREAQREYRETVAEVAHDFRTPLQILVFDLQWISRLDAVKDSAPTLERISQSLTRAVAADEHVLRLLGTATEQKERIDLVELLGEVMKDLKPMADRHPCEQRKVGNWPNHAIVWGSAYHLRRALTNLIENAIKYSWRGKKTDRGYELHKVNVSVELWSKNMVCVRISNYGIGIPNEKIEQIKESGGRALVPDAHYQRPGTGRGLLIATGVLEDHGGFLNIRSEPTDSNPRPAEELYHRYVTTVDAFLPVIL